MSECITTPASCERRPTVAVLGAGIAGLTAAHELAERGFDVTVYEYREDERIGIGNEPADCYPPVKLGGLAASQYSTVGTADGSPAELRAFPGRRGMPRLAGRAVAGEHGFRFFPAYYLHTWDLFQRIPIYRRTDCDGERSWQSTSRTVMDNVRRVVTQGTTVAGRPSLVFPREAPRSPAEFLGVVSQLAGLGFTVQDVQTFVGRLLRYLVTSPIRRASELQNLSAYDFFVGRDNPTGAARYTYTERFDELLREMPKVLAAFDSRWGDARTNLTTYLQLQLQMDRRDDKADGVLNGPTTESWFDHWYRHLVTLGVDFVHGRVTSLEPPTGGAGQPPHLRPRVRLVLADGTRVAPDYTVVAVDAPGAEALTTAMRAAGGGGTVAGLSGFATSAPPPAGPLQPAATRPVEPRDPYDMDQMGKVAWDRFQTLGGIQYFFDTEFQLLRGHMYYSGTKWALSSINQHGLWERRPTLARDGHISVLSVDIGDFNTCSDHLLDEHGRGKAARDCTADEIAVEVWRQIVEALTSNVDNVPEALLPWPAWYALDRGLVTGGGPGQGGGPVIRNETPYLVPIVGDWPNRPGGSPWNPHNTSWGSRPPEDFWLEDLEERNVWQARHGGYQVHDNSVVFAGTWAKTFTRMTSMEAACESGRHAVNAILDHYIWVESGGRDRREKTTLDWRFPYGFLDQGFSSPIRMPSPIGDYCYVFDIENREPADTRPLRSLDSQYFQESLPHPLESPAGGSDPSPVIPPAGGQPMTTFPMDENQQMLAYLQAWRQLLEGSGSLLPGMAPGMPPMPGMPPIPGMPPMPPVVPGAPAAAPSPTDYTRHLFAYLQAWRQHLEQAVGAPPQPPKPAAPQSPPPRPAEPSPTDPNAGGRYDTGSSTMRPPSTAVPPANEDGSQVGTPSLYGRGRGGRGGDQTASASITPVEDGARSLFGRRRDAGRTEHDVLGSSTLERGSAPPRRSVPPDHTFNSTAETMRKSATSTKGTPSELVKPSYPEGSFINDFGSDAAEPPTPEQIAAADHLLADIDRDLARKPRGVDDELLPPSSEAGR